MSRKPTHIPDDRAGLIPADALSRGGWVICALAVISSILIAFRPGQDDAHLDFWTFTRAHAVMYEPALKRWNSAHPDRDVDMAVINAPAPQQRMLAGFLAETSVADLLEVERKIAGQAFAGPIEEVGFIDLRGWLESEGILDNINPPSLGLWSREGRIYGLPHDVHPVMLCYRADIVEAAGIDVSEIETWDDFARVMSPLMTDADNDGENDRYALAFDGRFGDHMELLVLQAGGSYFDAAGQPTINSDVNARVLAEVAAWCEGPDAIATDVPDYEASGNQLKKNGYVLSWFAPDWMCYLVRNEIPELSGKVKLMPLPAWEPGGLRTSVWGGAMLGISKTTDDRDAALEVARELYLSDELVHALYRQGDIITPLRNHWDDPIFDEPDAFYSGQRKGRMYIDLAPHIPVRTNSPYFGIAVLRVKDAFDRLRVHARSEQIFDPDQLEPEAKRLLEQAQAAVMRYVDRNIFLGGDQP